MNLPAGWTVFPSPFRWSLLVYFNDLRGSGRWYRIADSGDVTTPPYDERALQSVISPDNSRALLIGNSSFHEGTHGLWTILRSVVDLRSNSSSKVKLAIGCEPAWSNDGRQFAYTRATEAWSNVEKRFVSCLKNDAALSLEGGELLSIHHLGADSILERPTRPVRCLRWRPDDRALIAVVGDSRGLSAVTFTADDLVPVEELSLPVEPTAQGLSISPDGNSLSFCDFASDDDAPYFGSICGLADGRVVPIGPQCLDSRPIWSPTGRWLAFHLWKEAGPDCHQMMTITDPEVREIREVASVNSGDLSGEITGPDPAWSADGGQLAFGSSEAGGSAIYLAEISSGTCVKVLQTEGLIHSLGFLKAP